jgi:hypothetical protein
MAPLKGTELAHDPGRAQRATVNGRNLENFRKIFREISRIWNAQQ